MKNNVKKPADKNRVKLDDPDSHDTYPLYRVSGQLEPANPETARFFEESRRRFEKTYPLLEKLLSERSK